MAANLSGVLPRLASVVVQPDASKNYEAGPNIFCVFGLLHVCVEIFVARQAARDRRPISSEP